MDLLARYFDETDDTPSRLAERIKRSPSTITRVLKGERRPSFELARDIERGTDGRIKAAEIIAASMSMGHAA